MALFHKLWEEFLMGQPPKIKNNGEDGDIYFLLIKFWSRLFGLFNCYRLLFGLLPHIIAINCAAVFIVRSRRQKTIADPILISIKFTYCFNAGLSLHKYYWLVNIFKFLNFLKNFFFWFLIEHILAETERPWNACIFEVYPLMHQLAYVVRYTIL